MNAYFNGGWDKLNADVTFNKNAYINWNSKDLNGKITCNGDSLIINGDLGNLNGNFVKDGGVIRVAEDITDSKAILTNGGTLEDNQGEMPIIKSDILTTEDYQEEEEINVDFTKLEDEIDITASDMMNSGNVLDVTYFAQLTDESILNNLEPSDAIDDSYFTKVYYAKATEAIAEIAEYIEDFLFVS
jgi:hypothetical protein